MEGANATYVYCVVKARKGAKPGRLPKGLEGAGKTRPVDAGDGYQLIVTTAPLALYGGEMIDAKLRDLDWVGGRAAEHEAVVEHMLKVGTVIPMKLFTLFTNDDRAIQHVHKMKRSLDRVVERIAGCEEWGLRILLDETRAARASARGAGAKKVATGTDFLLRKKALDTERRTSDARATTAAHELYEDVAKIARRDQKRPAPNRELAKRVLLDAVFLVPSSSVKNLKTVVASSAKKLVPVGLDITLTGPWPAYSFIGGP
jgi:hypothetical protein